MTDERYIRTGNEQWTSMRPFELQWKTSQKGNAYIELDVRGQRVVVTVFPSQFRRTGQDEWTFSVRTGDEWLPSRQFFPTQDAAKESALLAIVEMRRAQTESVVIPPTIKREPVRDEPVPPRRIRL